MAAIISALWLMFVAIICIYHLYKTYRPYRHGEAIASIGAFILMWAIAGWIPVGVFYQLVSLLS